MIFSERFLWWQRAPNNGEMQIGRDRLTLAFRSDDTYCPFNTQAGKTNPMAEDRVVFEDGDAYEHTMGVWSRLVGEVFLDWLAPPSGLRWIDIGCGSGAFTELLIRRSAPSEIQGIDPSDGQLAFARTRPGARGAMFLQGDALALPFAGDRFDAAVMALVIFFLPDAAKGVAEMARVVRPGGMVATYVWDAAVGGSPFFPITDEMRTMGFPTPGAPNPAASRIDKLCEMWAGAGLEAVETREIAVTREFADFDDFWNNTLRVVNVRPGLERMPPGEVEVLKARLRVRLPADGRGRIVYGARANAIEGRVA
jgi:SAM-dependent methyltransferase